MDFKKVLFGEPMPDKNDPKYKARYEREVEMGRKFGEKVGLPRLVMYIQLWANRHPKRFLAVSFGTVILCLLINVCYMFRGFLSSGSQGKGKTAVEQVDSALIKQHSR